MYGFVFGDDGEPEGWSEVHCSEDDDDDNDNDNDNDNDEQWHHSEDDASLGGKDSASIATIALMVAFVWLPSVVEAALRR